MVSLVVAEYCVLVQGVHGLLCCFVSFEIVDDASLNSRHLKIENVFCVVINNMITPI